MVGGLEKFHYFTFGCPVKILTDHKPLISISKKSLVNALPRLQHLLLCLNNYNAELTWIPGKDMIFSDHLSCNVNTDAKQNEPTCKGLDLKVHDVFLNASREKCVSLANEMSKDPVLITLKHMIIEGWPKQRGKCPENLKIFWNYRDELSILDSLVLKGTRIVIPSQCQEDILNQLHEAHFDTDHTKMHARDSVYWPQINKEIEQLVKSCEICQENSCRNQKDPSIPREVLMTPWLTIEMVLFTLDQYSFLLVVDVTSRFPVVCILSNETCSSVINALKGVYCDFGLPRKIITDIGPCFKAVDFTEFHYKLGVITETSSAYNHKSVGSVE